MCVLRPCLLCLLYDGFCVKKLVLLFGCHRCQYGFSVENYLVMLCMAAMSGMDGICTKLFIGW